MESDTIYVRLIGEGVDVYRPVPATRVAPRTYVLKGKELFVPDDEDWEFGPGATVMVERRILGGESVLVAISSLTVEKGRPE